MRPAAKHWLFFAFLAVSLAVLIAFAAWQISKARHEAEQSGVGVPASRLLEP